MWRKPQASQWDPSGTSLRGYITLWDDVNHGNSKYESVAAELRQIEDRHGLSAKSLLQLRWVLPDPAPEPEASPVVEGQPARGYGTVSPEQRRRVIERLHADHMNAAPEA
jgi:hypothetical protein